MSLTRNEFERFQKYISLKCGIDLDEKKAYLIESRLAKLLIDSGCKDFSELLKLIESNSDAYIETKIIDSITTNETFWFRDSGTWDFLKRIWLPKVIDEIKIGKRQKIRIWSAAVSTGQEIYSVLMTISEYLIENDIDYVSLEDFEFLGTDISESVLAIAKKGKYDSITIMRGMPSGLRDKYFDNFEGVWVIKDRYRKLVRFEQFNLQNSFIFLGHFDLILCRYVLIYFTDLLRNEVFEKMAGLLNSEGLFIIGASEIYYSMEHYFEKRITKHGSHFVLRRT